MASYIILEPPGSTQVTANRVVAIRDGFALFAFLVPVIWFFWHRMWLPALGLLLVSVALGLAETQFHLPAIPLFSLCLLIFIGLEARIYRVGWYRRKGWHEWGLVDAESVEEAKLIYKMALKENRHVPAKNTSDIAFRSDKTTASQGPALGLVDYQ